MGTDSGFQIEEVAVTAYARETAVFMQPLVDALLDAAAPGPGAHLLDVACGPGILARSAAPLVGPSGRLVGVDINAGMVAAARRGPTTEPAIEWHVASAEDLPFADAAFDVVAAQQGIQFFGDLPAAVAEMARVTRPGGRVAATSWSPMPDSPFLHAQYRSLVEAVGDEAVATFPGAFRLTADDLRTAWEDAGLRDVTVELVAPEVRLPPIAAYAAAQIRATPWGAALDAVDADARDRSAARVAELLAEHRTSDGGATVNFSTHLVVGTA